MNNSKKKATKSKDVGLRPNLGVDTKVKNIARGVTSEKAVSGVTMTLSLLLFFFLVLLDGFSAESFIVGICLLGFSLIIGYVLVMGMSYSIATVIYELNSPRIKKGSRLFIVDENNVVFPVCYAKRELLKWNLSDEDNDWIYYVFYEWDEKKVLRKVSASKVFLKAIDAEEFAKEQAEWQRQQLEKQLGKEEANSILFDAEISDIRTVYAYNWDPSPYGNIGNIDEYYKEWEERIKSYANKYVRNKDLCKDVAYQTDIRCNNEYYKTSTYIGNDVNFLATPVQVAHFIRFYNVWKEGEKAALVNA